MTPTPFPGAHAMIHPRCDLCAEHPEGAHCWTHTYKRVDPRRDGRYRCRHCTAVGHQCPDCDGTGIMHGVAGVTQVGEFDVEDDCPTCHAYGVIDDTVGTPVIHKRRMAR